MRKHSLWILAAAGLLSVAGCGPREVGMIAIYEVDADKAASGAKPTDEQMQILIRAIEGRLHSGSSGRAQQLDDGRIEVSIFRADPEVMQRIADMLPRAGTLEFRILANNRDHKEQIAQARKTEAKTAFDAQGEMVAWWVPVPNGREDIFTAYPEIDKRIVDLGGKETMEVLVVKDPFNVTGEYLTHCEPGVDQHGRPCVNLAFGSRGGQLFGGLTGANLPDEVQVFTRKLGIILDRYLYSAPAIQATIGDRAQITGSFTEQEVEDLVDVLNAGSLPVAIRKVEQRTVTP